MTPILAVLVGIAVIGVSLGVYEHARGKMNALKLTHVSNFLTVECICGMTAIIAPRRNPETGRVIVDVVCDHGGAQRSITPAFSSSPSFDASTVLAHVDANSPIAPLGGAKLGDGQRWTGTTPVSYPPPVSRRPILSQSAVPVPKTWNPTTGRNRPNYPSDEMAQGASPGLIVRGPLGKLQNEQFAVVLTSLTTELTTKLSMRRIGDDAFMVHRCPSTTIVHVVADQAMTKGDPDRFMADMRDAVRRLKEKAVAVQPIGHEPVESIYEKKQIHEAVNRAGYTPGDLVTEHRHAGVGRVVGVRHLGSYSSSLVIVDVVWIDGPDVNKRGAVEPHRLSHYQPTVRA